MMAPVNAKITSRHQNGKGEFEEGVGTFSLASLNQRIGETEAQGCRSSPPHSGPPNPVTCPPTCGSHTPLEPPPAPDPGPAAWPRLPSTKDTLSGRARPPPGVSPSCQSPNFSPSSASHVLSPEPQVPLCEVELEVALPTGLSGNLLSTSPYSAEDGVHACGESEVILSPFCQGGYQDRRLVVRPKLALLRLPHFL